MSAPSDLDLLESYLARELPPEREREIELRLFAEPGLAERLVALAREESLLREWARGRREAKMLRVMADPVPPTISVSTRPRFTPARSSLLVMAAMLLLCLAGPWLEPVSSPPALPPGKPVGEIKEFFGKVEVINARGEREPARAGRPLLEGERLRTGEDGSFALVEMTNRNQLEVGSSTFLEMLRASDDTVSQISVWKGYVRADVQSHAAPSPMILSTPHALVRVTDSIAGFWSDARGTRLELEEGEAELVRNWDGQSVSMHKGELVIASPSPEVLRPRPLPLHLSEADTILDHATAPVQATAFSPDGELVATGAHDGTIRLWERSTGLLLRVIPAHGPKRRRILALAYGPNQKYFVSTAQDKTVKVWHARTGKLHKRVRFNAEIHSVAFSPDGRRLALIGESRQGKAVAHLFDPQRGKKVHTIVEGKKRFESVAFSPSGKHFALGDRAGQVRIHEVGSAKPVHAFRAHRDDVRALVFSPDGKRLVTGGRDGKARIWATSDWTALGEIEGYHRAIRSLAYSPDGGMIAVASDDRVRLWDVEGEMELATLRSGSHHNSPIRFAPDGLSLATAGRKRTAQLWDLNEVLCD